MKKAVTWTILLIVLAVIVVVYYAYTNIDRLVEMAIEKYGGQATQTEVRVEAVSIKLSEGAGSIRELSVANPEGFEPPYALTLGEIATNINIKKLSEPYVMESITVRALHVLAIVNQKGKTNLVELKNNLQSSAPAGEQPPDKDDAEQPRLIIQELLFAQGTIDARVMPLNKQYTLDLPTIQMNNLGGSEGATPTELAREILDRIVDQALQEIKNQGIDTEIEKLKSQGQEKLEKQGGTILQQGKEQLEDRLKGAVN